MRRLSDLSDEMVELSFEKPAVLCAPPLAAQANPHRSPLTLTLTFSLALALALILVLTRITAGLAERRCMHVRSAGARA